MQCHSYIQNSSLVYTQSGSPLVVSDTGALASCQAATAPLYQLAESVYTMCLCIHLPSSRLRQQVAPVVLAVQSSAVVNHAHEHVNIQEYMEHFRGCTDLGNQGVINAI